jgi:TRAP-type mannitol/chloroaromatic compound transport system substrate-binding protein
MNPIKSTYQLDGVERKNSDGSSSKMYWDGNKLVLVTTRSRPEGGMSTFQNVWSLDGEGNLVMERTLSTPGSKPAALKSVLKKIR